MGGSHTARAGILAAFLLAVVGFAAGVWWFAFTSALDQLEERGRADLALAADRLTGHLRRFRELGVLLSDHPTLTALALTGDNPGNIAQRLLQEMADKTGTLSLLLVGDAGQVLAASRPAEAADDLADQPYFQRAMDGALGADQGVNAATGQRIFSYAAPVFQPGGPARGAVVVRVDIAALEADWPTDPSPVYFSGEAGVVLVTNRSELILTARDPGAAMPGAGAFPGFGGRDVAGHRLWTVDGGRYLPNRALHLAQDLPVIGMRGEILLDLRPVLRLANLQAAVAAALFLAFGAMLFLAAERRRVLAVELQAEAAANAALEARVAARTEELSLANADLRHEIAERKEAEAALTRAQADLVQAGKLSALGQMSAGISHELNQPLMAIQSLAGNADVLLDRGNTAGAAENLGRIGEMARRMGRIIRNLRAFARQESVAPSDVDLVAVIDAALEIAGPKIASAGVTLIWPRPAGRLMVRGGEVRLQQVVLNLVSNAVDAMQTSPQKRIAISLDTGAPIRLHVRDTGPGIAEPKKIFDPFYTTKEVGDAEGMGLGLSISYGLVQSFGGAIRGRNHPDGGAVFTVSLSPAGLERAA